jgi:S-DNA-T family DNA segregation ATPase FtsK/SpoIIIE
MTSRTMTSRTMSEKKISEKSRRTKPADSKSTASKTAASKAAASKTTASKPRAAKSSAAPAAGRAAASKTAKPVGSRVKAGAGAAVQQVAGGGMLAADRLGSRLREGAFIGFAFVCVYAFIALSTYHADDPGWSTTGVGHEAARNTAGLIGAYLSDVFYTLFGYMAFLFPIMLGYRAWLIFRERHQPAVFDGFIFALRLVGFVLVMLSATGLSHINVVEQAVLPEGAGGVLGTLVGQTCLDAFNVTGSRLLLLAIFLFGITLFTGLSWLTLMDDTGRLALVAYRNACTYISQRIERWQERQERQTMLRKRQMQMESPELADDPPVQARVSTARKKLPAKPPEIAKPLVAEQPLEKTLEKTQILDAMTPSAVKVAAAASTEPAQQADVKPASAPRISVLKKPLEQGERLFKEMQTRLFDTSHDGTMPHIDLLNKPDASNKKGFSEEALQRLASQLVNKLKDFGIEAVVKGVLPGPVITRFEIEPAAGVKVSKITGLAKDLARSLSVVSVRVVEVIPGKSYVGIEIPNEDRQMVFLSEVLSSKTYEDARSPLTLALGHDIAGAPIMADLAKMPHLLVAGTTGSGKSVGVNAMLLSILYKAGPDEVRLMMVDPKMLELSVYDGIPHLLTPVITDMNDAASGLRWCVGEMERRYKMMAALGVRNLQGYNRKIKEAAGNGLPIPDPLWNPEENLLNPDASLEPPELEALPFIVVVIDEFADMMMIVGKKVEELIARIAQKARAAGIHLVLATQRPSVDVITGLIKANIPSRIAFQVSSKIDSRTILDQGGADQLLGHGDMLYLPPGTSLPVRVHGAFVDDDEVHRVVSSWKQRAEPNYIQDLLQEGASEFVPGYSQPGSSGAEDDPESEPLYDEAVHFVTQSRKASISAVQRKLRIGYNRAARMIETMEEAGVISSMGTNGQREVLAPSPPGD